ncbi:ferrochelatase [Parenemella sanctibonifatiensis]|nr:ferrochelatase [Parenemella sanctibonifatiensis]
MGTEQVETVLADQAPLAPYDLVLLMSFGGPEAPEEVVPFLRRVTAGRGIPDSRLEEVGEHYFGFGGRSPINDQNRGLLRELRAELGRRGITTPVVWSNRNSEPFLPDVLQQAYADRARRVLAITTSAFGSYSSCRQYREDLGMAVADLPDDLHIDQAFQIDKVRPYFNHPGFVQANGFALAAALQQLVATRPVPGAEPPLVVFVTHSIPDAMADGSAAEAPEGAGYTRQHEVLATEVIRDATARLAERHPDAVPGGWELTYCSRSGSPHTPWLEPDVNDRLVELAAAGVREVVLAPIGFVSDHMEVAFDLDTEARETATEHGIRVVRAATAGLQPAFVSGLVDLALERAAEARAEQATSAANAPEPAVVGELPAWPSRCRPGCCLARAGQPTDRPTLCEQTA